MKIKKVFVVGKWPGTSKSARVDATFTEEPEGDFPTISVENDRGGLIGIVLTPNQAKVLATALIDMVES